MLGLIAASRPYSLTWTALFLLILAFPARPKDVEAPWRPLAGFQGVSVHDLCTDGEVLWAATERGLYRISAYAVERLPVLRAPLRLAAGAGAVFVVEAHTLWRLNRSGEASPVALPGIDADATFLSVVSGPRILARRVDGTHALYEPATGWTDLAGLSPASPTCLGWDGERCRVGTDRGVWDGRAFVSHEPVDWLPRFPGDVDSVSVEHRGEIWRGTQNGIERRRLVPRFRRIDLPASDSVHALALGTDGSIWCGTNEGVARVHEGRVVETRAIDGRALGTTTAVAVDREGRVWIGSGSSFTGVYRLDERGWSHLGAEEGFVDAYVHRITADWRTGTLWFAVLNAPGGGMTEGEGAWLYSAARFQEFPPQGVKGSLPSQRVYDITRRDPAGVLWFATLKGLAALEGGRLFPYGSREGLKGKKIWCLAAARDGSLWLGYQEARGVTRITRGEVRHFTTKDGLCDDRVWSIVEGPDGVLWFATEKGLSRFDGRRWSSFWKEDGLPVERLWPLLAMPDGTVYIGTLGEGLVHFVPDDRLAPRTFFLTDRRTVEGLDGTIAWRGADAWFRDPSATIHFRWRWDDGPWSEVGPSASVEMPATAGHHVLQVQAIDRLGNVELPGADLSVVVMPTVSNMPAIWILALVGVAVFLVLLVLLARRLAT